MPEEQPTERHPDLVPALQGWHSAKERARRYNRNLLQYAGGAVALLGVTFGTGAVFAVAEGVDNGANVENNMMSDTELLPVEVLIIAAVMGVIVLVLLCFMARAFLVRGSAERDATRHLNTLIAIDPDRVWSSEE